MTAIAQLDGTIFINNEPDIVDITRANPGQTFVGILPGHDRPAFVRKRRRSGSCFADLFRPKRTYSSEHVYHTYTESKHSNPYHTTKIVTDSPVVVASGGSSLPSSPYVRYTSAPARLMKHTCGSCGKFRSNTYCKANPLAEGEVPKPSLCKKCVHNQTSSDDSDRSYKEYVKKQKRRRRRQLREDEDDSYERYRKAQNRQRASSMDDSYERYNETRSYRRQGRAYTVSESGYSSYEGRDMRRPKVIYVERSNSRRHTRTSSELSLISVSIRSQAPRRLRRESRTQSSAEEVRGIRSIMRVSPRPKRSSSPYRHRYRSETRSEGSVRFDLPPPRERAHRKYRVLNYDGEPAPYEEMVRSLSPDHSYSTEVVYDSPCQAEYRAPFKEHWDKASPSPIRCVATPDNARYDTRDRDADLESLAFMSGSRGRSLSSERRALKRDESLRREQRRRSRSAGRASSEYGTSSDESSANYIPQYHPSYRLQTPTAVRVSRLMQRLALENPQDGDTARAAPARRQIEYAYVRPRTPSRGRTPSRQRSGSHHRSPSRQSNHRRSACEVYVHREIGDSPKRYRYRCPSQESHSRPPVHEQYITGGEDYAGNRHSERSAARDRLPENYGGWDFDGRVRHVRAPDRLG